MICQICGRQTPEEYSEKHHLMPKVKKGPTINVCSSCGDQLHQLFDNSTLRRKLNTLQVILADEKIQKWINWVSKRSDFSVCMKSMKRR